MNRYDCNSEDDNNTQMKHRMKPVYSSVAISDCSDYLENRQVLYIYLYEYILVYNIYDRLYIN